MGKKQDAGREVERLFRAAIASVVLHNEQVSAQVGMNASESQTLHLLQLHGDLSPSQLAGLTGLSSATMTGVLDRLEALGFARRERHPTDRRKVVVSVDEARLYAELAPHYSEQAAHLASVIDAYTAAELETVADFLGRLVPSPSEDNG